MIFVFLPLLLVLLFSETLGQLFNRKTYIFRKPFGWLSRGSNKPPIGNEASQEIADHFGSFQVMMFRLAFRSKGRLTLSEVIVESGMDLDRAEKLMDRMVDGSRVQMNVNDNGIIFYEFPEIIARFEH